MPDGVSFEIEGAEALNAKLKGLTQDIKFKGGRFALRKAAQVVARKAASNAKRLDDPATGNQIALNIVNGNKYPGVRWSSKTFKRTGNLGFRVGIAGGARPLTQLGEVAGKGSGNPGGDTWYWRLLEFGFTHKKSGKKIAATPFLRTAISESSEAAISEFVKQYDKALDRALRKLEREAKG